MLGLVTIDELREIFNDDDADHDTCLDYLSTYFPLIVERSLESYKSRPSFFTPYKNFEFYGNQVFSGTEQFCGELLAPLVYPLANIVVASLATLIAAVSVILFVFNMLIGVGATVFGNTELRDEYFDALSFNLFHIGMALIATVASTLLALISIPHSLASVVTRSTVTALSALEECSEDEYKDYQHASSFK